MGLDCRAALQAGLAQVRQGADRLASSSRQGWPVGWTSSSTR